MVKVKAIKFKLALTVEGEDYRTDSDKPYMNVTVWEDKARIKIETYYGKKEKESPITYIVSGLSKWGMSAVVADAMNHMGSDVKDTHHKAVNDWLMNNLNF